LGWWRGLWDIWGVGWRREAVISKRIREEGKTRRRKKE
jgi:hypothetical protein